MPANRRFGMDHHYYDWSPLNLRPAIHWPKAAPLAFSVVVNLEHLEANAPRDAVQSRWLSGGLGPRPFPDIARLSHREYGHRVGIFRLLDVMERHKIPVSVAVDAMTAELYPWLIGDLKRRGVEFIAHGISVSRMITSRMSEAEERAYIQQSLDRIEGAIGIRPTGWMGPEQGESERTLELLAEYGMTYVCDWSNDEQPYPMTVEAGALWAMPTMLEYDDAFALDHRRMTLESYSSMFTRGVDQLIIDGQSTGRYLLLNLRPWLSGQPFRIGCIDEMVHHAVSTRRVWAASVGEVAAWCATSSHTSGVTR